MLKARWHISSKFVLSSPFNSLIELSMAFSFLHVCMRKIMHLVNSSYIFVRVGGISPLFS